MRRSVSETSPHTRGELLNALAGDEVARNIPAYAGRTFWSTFVAAHAEKHPRIRGENLSVFQQASTFSETSPHTRGEQQHIESLIPFCTVFSMLASF